MLSTVGVGVRVSCWVKLGGFPEHRRQGFHLSKNKLRALQVSPEKLRISVIVHVCFFVSWLLMLLFWLSVCPSLCLHLTLPDPKLCPIPMTPNGHLDLNLPLGGPLGPAGAAAPARLSLQPDPMLVALGSRKSSVMSLGRMSSDQRSLVSPCGELWVAAPCWVCAEKCLPFQLQTGSPA